MSAADQPTPTSTMEPTTRSQSARDLPKAFNRRLLFACSLMALAQFNFGMDQSAFNSTQAMLPFVEQFGSYDQSTDSYIIEAYFLSFLNSFPYIGFAFGLLMGSYVSNRFGRRTSMFSMCAWAIVAAIILVTAKSREQVLTGRVLAYVYNGMALAVVPVFQSELVPGHVRGFVVSTFQLGLLLGQLIMSLICRGTSGIDDNASWKVPFGLFFIIPVIVGGLIFFTPESPRWLLIKGRSEDCMASLVQLRQGRFSQEEIQEEFRILKTNIDLTVEKGRAIEIFQGTNLKRTMIVTGCNLLLQLTGQNFVGSYGTIFFQSLGTVNPFTMISTYYGINTFFTLITMLLTDYTGRVPLMMAGAFVQAGALMTMGGLGVPAEPSMAAKKGITAMVIVFGMGYQLGWAPLAHVISAEIPTTRLRDPTYALGSFCNIVIQFTINFSMPYLLYAPYANLESKVGFIFGSLAVVAFFFSWLCIPECKGKSLEEVDRLFLDGVPIRKFGKTSVNLAEMLQGDKDMRKAGTAIATEEV